MKPRKTDPSIAKLHALLSSAGGVSKDQFDAAVGYLSATSDPLTLLADFSEVYPGYDYTLPRLFNEVCCGGNFHKFTDAKERASRISDQTMLNSTNGTPERLCFYKIFYPGGSWSTHVDALRESHRCKQPTTSQPIRELIMSSSTNTLNVLRQLAKKDTIVDDMTSLVGKVSPELETALKEMQDAEDKEKAKADAKVVFDLLKSAQAHIDTRVVNLRSIRKSVADEKAKILALDKARAYAVETKNFLPLLALIEGDATSVKPEEAMIPEDWKPKV